MIAGSLSLGGAARTFTVADGLAADDLTISAAISNGTLVKAGAGTLVLSGSNNFTSGTFNEVDVRNGTLRLAASGGETLGLGTQVTVGSGLGPATLDLAAAPQTLASLRFSGSAGTVVGGGAEGDLKLSNNGAAATVAVLDGTAHDIQSAVTLDAATTFDVATDGRLKVSGAISPTAFGLTKTGQGVLELSGANAYQGITEIQAGTLLINGSTIANSAISVSSGAVLGGNGIIGGNLTLASGAFFAFDTASTLTLNGSLTLDSSFGVGSLRDLNGNAINWDSIEEGTYTLMNTSFTFDDLNISNFGFANRTPVAAGKYAYFENGSLELEVVPEPTTLALASLGAALAVWMARRRRR